MISYVVTDGGISAVIDGKQYTVARDNPVYTQVRGAIIEREGDEVIARLFRTADSIKRYTGDKINIKNGELFYEGAPVRNVVTERIFEFMQKGLPYMPLIRFLDRLRLNPSKESQEELYNFLEINKLAITEEGYLLGYKGLDNNYKDQFSHTIDNSIGLYISMPRCKVDSNRQRECSYGFHVGRLEYATGYGPKTVIVQVDPADVVSVPAGNHSWKIRVCKYKVLCDYRGPLPKPLYHADVDPYEDVWHVESGL